MIYVIRDDFTELPCDIERWEAALGAGIVEKARKYKFQKDRALCIYSQLLMRYALRREYKMTNAPKIVYSKGKKPYFKDCPVKFNISHCDTGVACVVDRENVGIDIQDHSEVLVEIRNNYMNCREKKAAEYARLWSLKEAYGKYYGYGMNYPYKDKDFSELCHTNGWQSFEGLKVYSAEYDDFALGVFTHSEMKVHMLSRKEVENEFH